MLQYISTPAPERAQIEASLPPLQILPTPHKDYAPAPLQISVYLDSSQTGQGVDYKYTVYYDFFFITQRFGPAGPKTEVYDAELMDIIAGLKATIN
jgi:hypothetical protein